MIVPAANILDTNVVSEMMRPLPNPRVVSFLDSAAPEGMGVSVISVWEIFHGIRQLPAGKRRDDLDFRFRTLVLEMFENRVFPWEAEDAKACADLMEHKRRLGESMDSHLTDAMIAGTALRRGLRLVTRNEKDFKNTDIEVVNPWKADLMIHQGIPGSLVD